MTDKKKIEILQKENARLRKEQERWSSLTSDNVTEYVNNYEMTARELFIELQELRDNYRTYCMEAEEILRQLRDISLVERKTWRKIWKRKKK